ncbi:hypothetical protein BDY17DRAFT_317423 [Neohortaea acidophila]|uniref:Sec61beta family-domain-containing protein n=1 Tax=Neohortaea acidophila TaxID=245834 RepID=A0A6A6PPU2_9PEZI|nr:uncharacterized protein BDY17DRAFT_317423 [Neohortaea acidophila]KAF2481644.1 hypothetical protein BDY17DRAFT_317423 [Neohortaea acidophila]
MAYYDNDPSWPSAGRASSWEVASRPAAGQSPSSPQQQQHPEPHAFAAQFEEIERATDNLVKSGKWFPGAMQHMAGGMGARQGHVPPPPMNRGHEQYGGGDARMGGAPARQASGGAASDYDPARPGSAGLQGYYQGQRFPGGARASEAEQMLQAKRRMAAQRERELRNYHQEQQYNRNVSGVKSDRSMSPNPMSEEDRRDLIARQHRALYGDAASLYGAEAASSRPQSQDVVRGSHSGRGASPLAFDPYANQGPSSEEGAVQMPPRGDHLNTTTSPLSNTTTQQSFGLMSAGAQQSSRTSASSPGAKGNATGVAPIGTRPLPGSASAGSGVNQRATTPLTSSSLGFNSNNNNSAGSANPKDERSTSAASNPASTLAESGANPTAISKGSSSPRPSSPVNSPTTGSTTARAASPKAPGGPATAIKRRAAADRADKVANARPTSTRAAGAGGSSSTMLRLYTDESPGLKVDPFVVMVLSIGFIISVVALHILAKVTKRFSS